MSDNQKVLCHFLGLIDYKEAWDFQETIFKSSIDLKIARRNGETDELPKHHLLFCQHPHVYTLGKSGKEAHLLLDESQLDAKEAKFYKINRGGDITYHGPGQIVGYPIVKLKNGNDVVGFVREIEIALINTCQEFGVHAERYCERTGVWIRDAKGDRKLAAIGVRVAKGVTMHGFALNVNPDLSWFKKIVPCGIPDVEVTSLSVELGRNIAIVEILESLTRNITSALDKVAE